MERNNLNALIKSARACAVCSDLPLGPKPIFQISTQAKILVAGQAPGRKTHHKGIPFDDPSGNRLREWMGLSREQFYDPTHIAIVPMGFCFPGNGKGGDLPPRLECAPKWRHRFMAHLQSLKLILVIGKYARDWYLPDRAREPLTQTIADWESFAPAIMPLPHPSPRNNRWLKNNPWFEVDTLPVLREYVKVAMS